MYVFLMFILKGLEQKWPFYKSLRILVTIEILVSKDSLSLYIFILFYCIIY